MPPPVTLLGVGPGEVSAIGGGLTLRLGVHPTPFGQALLAVSERGISSLQFLDSVLHTRRP
jgi:AraC family transcriptional regulator, regulatory protein of adaptative response / methylated-DNA-[protein]-cysteine methyltransferase